MYIDENSDDWLMWGFNFTVYDERVSDPNFDCDTLQESDDPDDDAVVCICQSGYVGDQCIELDPDNTQIFWSHAVLDFDGITAVVDFTGDIFTPGTLDCTTYFDANSEFYESLGSGVECEAISASEFQITLGDGATIELYSPVLFEQQPFIIHEGWWAAFGPIYPSLVPSEPAPIPQVTFTGAQTVGICQDVSVNIGVTNLLGRAGVYNWVISPTNLANADAETQVDSIEESAMNSVVLSSDLFAGASTVDFIVTVKNWWGETSAITTYEVARINGVADPYVTLSDLPDTIPYTDDIIITSSVEFDPCVEGATFSINYLWSSPDGINIPSPSAADLFVPSGTDPGYYCFNLEVQAIVSGPDPTITYSDSGLVNTQECVTIERPGVVAIIAGGDTRQTTFGTAITFTSESFDPLGSILTYSWNVDEACVTENFSGTLDGSSLTIIGTDQQIASGCQVSLTVTAADENSDTDTVTLDILDQGALDVSILINSPYVVSGGTFYVSVNDDIDLSAVVVDPPETLSYTWTELLGNLNDEGIQSASNGGSFILSNAYLLPGLEFSVRVRADDEASDDTGFATIDLKVNSPPSANCAFTPSNGTVLETEWVFVCDDVSDDQGDTTFELFVNYEGQDTLVWKSKDPFATFPTLPIGDASDFYKLDAKIVITDRVGDNTTIDISPYVYPPDAIVEADEDGLIALQQSVEATISGDIDTNLAPAVLNLDLTDTILHIMSEDSLLDYSSGVPALRDSMLDQLSPLADTLVKTKDNVLQVAQMARVIIDDPVDLNEEIQVSGVDFLDGLLKSAISLGDIADDPEYHGNFINAYVQAVQSIAEGSTLLDPYNIPNSLKIGDLFDVTAKTLCRARLIAEGIYGPFEHATDGYHMRCQRYDLLSLASNDVFDIESDLLDGVFNVPTTMIDTSDGTIVDVVSQANPINYYIAQDLAASSDSDIVSLEFVSDYLYSLDIIEASSSLEDNTEKTLLDTETLTIQLPVNATTLVLEPDNPESATDRRFRCNFMGLDGFSQQGCDRLGSEDDITEVEGTEYETGILSCGCNHLTTFVGGGEYFRTDIELENPEATGVALATALEIAEFPIILYILGGIYLTYLIGLIFARWHDEELFEHQLRSAVRYNKRRKRRALGLKGLQGIPKLEDNSDSDRSTDSKSGLNGIPKDFQPFEIKSNTAVMDLLRKLRDDCMPFAIEKKKHRNPKAHMEDEYIQRVRKLSSGANPDPDSQYEEIRRDAAASRGFRKRLLTRNGGNDIQEMHDVRDHFQHEALQRMYHENLKKKCKHKVRVEGPLALQTFWSSLDSKPASRNMFEGDEKRKRKMREQNQMRYTNFSDASGISDDLKSGVEGDHPSGDYHYFSDDEKDFDEDERRVRDGGEGRERRYSDFSDIESQMPYDDSSAAGDGDRANHSYISERRTDVTEDRDDFIKSQSWEEEDNRRYSYFSESLDTRADGRDSYLSEEGDNISVSKRRYSAFSGVQVVATEVEAEKPSADEGIVSGPDSDNDAVSFISGEAKNREKYEGVEGEVKDEGPIRDMDSPVDNSLLRKGGATPIAVAVAVEHSGGKHRKNESMDTHDFDGILQRERNMRAAISPETNGRSETEDDDSEIFVDEKERNALYAQSNKRQQLLTSQEAESPQRSSLQMPSSQEGASHTFSLSMPTIKTSNTSLPTIKTLSSGNTESKSGSSGKKTVPFPRITVSSVPEETSPSPRSGGIRKNKTNIMNISSREPVAGERKATDVPLTLSSQEKGHDFSSSGVSRDRKGSSNKSSSKKSKSDSVEGNQSSANEPHHDFSAMMKGTDKKKRKNVMEGKMSSLEAPHNFTTKMQKTTTSSSDLPSDTKSKMSIRLTSMSESLGLSDSSTDMEEENPSLCQFYKEAIKHYHCWIVFLFKSAYQFSVVERWTVLFCVILGTMAFNSILMTFFWMTPVYVLAFFAAVAMLPVEFIFTRMFIHSQNRVDIALGVNDKYFSVNVRFSALALSIFWMIVSGIVTAVFGTALEKRTVMNVWILCTITSIACAVDALMGEPLQLLLLVPWCR
eukprot:CAMPEP_0167768574 /NCGR_PEP_ID=MMETSP0110_2-20121227/16751_1 /TAXON_ID=629695 /ORGANISM="Gymnochlora sp., Strain CCMP2014" /LENGTH=2039 /DNA_ID=CAMNT_0007657279 /DNA_START=1216 /DNA_END=7335 /DNA_ORIENTATION=-